MPLRRRPNARAPWNNAAVIRSWRELSLSNRRLWTHISPQNSHICKVVDGMCITQFPMTRCYRQLERSRSLPLIVDILDKSCDCDQSVIRIAATQCRRWEIFTVDLEATKAVYFKELFPNHLNFSGVKFLEYSSTSYDCDEDFPV
ncbi:hypothetical protein BDV98DRAFT_99096 [Pterulicium gracile]|uniref:F-box domain-containing protein n=1 Tax=Pterulicium gracile TaxID=1884261 RepID=A0A5C3QFN8_9AGAR|nr:hypothetical protein BDV98DRAFT_99096 [Pterula gracilis]